MEETKSYKFINTRESVDTRKFHIFPGTFSQMLFITTGNTQIHKRSYKKLFDVIVQIGGFFNGIIYVAYFLNFLYSKNMIVWHCVTSLISTNEISENLDTNPNFKKSFEMDEISNSHRNKKTKEERVKLLEGLYLLYKKRWADIAEAITLEMGAPKDFSTQLQAGTGASHIKTFIKVLKD